MNDNNALDDFNRHHRCFSKLYTLNTTQNQSSTAFNRAKGAFPDVAYQQEKRSLAKCRRGALTRSPLTVTR